MARHSRRRFEALLARLARPFRGSFLRSIEDQSRRVDFAALTGALERGDTAEVILLLGFDQGSFGPVEEAIRATYIEGGDYELGNLPRRNPATGKPIVISFRGQQESAVRWVRERSSTFITETTQKQQAAIRSVLAAGLDDGRNPRSIALDLVGRVNARGVRTGGIIGLDAARAERVVKRRRELEAQSRTPAQIKRMVQRFANKLLRQRGESISRTETLAALNAGRLQGINQLIEAGEVLASAVKKAWDATGDIRTRNSHALLDEVKVAVNAPFRSIFGSLLLHPGDRSLGALAKDTVQCRCTFSFEIDFFAGVR